MDFPLHSLGDFCAVCVKNDKYVILLGGIDHGDDLRAKNDIFVMDIQLKKFGKCDINSPVKGTVKCTINNDKSHQEIVVCAFMRDLCKNAELEDGRVFPIYMTRIIGSYIGCEMVFLFWRYLGWKISVNALLNNTHFN